MNQIAQCDHLLSIRQMAKNTDGMKKLLIGLRLQMKNEQALRDLPANTVDIFNPIYPEQPQ
jgi:hypothetical protein